MKKGKSSSAGMKGKDMFTADRTSVKGFIPKPGKFGGTKNSTDIRPQPK
jgi:hypothetical protein|tara:strand:+ start:404 stop:550 length:147 start_codon:yes stop_codon:yes gene_type:complete